jgi:hypothetical protein
VKTIPGCYVGVQAGFAETVELRSEGTFRHRVIVDGKTNVDESGSWLFERGAVLLEPFTSFFDERRRLVVMTGSASSQGALFVMRYGRVAERISPSVGFEFCLTRTNCDSAWTNSDPRLPSEGAAAGTNRTPESSK